MIASEVSPWAKTGGLADVVGALPEALERLGHSVTVVMPRYRGLTPPAGESRTLRVPLGPTLRDVTLQIAALSERRRLVTVDAPSLFDREGLYGVGGVDYPDSAERFGVLCAAALEFAVSESSTRAFDVIHAHDWQAGLAATLLRARPDRYGALASAGLVFTIHNIAYQGLCPRDAVPALGLPWSVFRMDAAEFYGQLSLLKAGIAYSDFITTVSPRYARETLRPEFGSGMEGALATRAGRYVGILNGIDTAIWNPRDDRYLPATYDADDLGGKTRCKRALLDHFSLSVGDDAQSRPVIGMVSRLVEQKGLDIVREAAPALMKLDASWVFVGMGDARYEQFLSGLSARYPSRVGVHIGFSEQLAHLVEAGADMFLMPSKFEPCGLNQMYSLRYGTVPVVTAVGGLEDTVQPYTVRARRANGFKLKAYSSGALVRTLRHAVRLFGERDIWRALMRQGMSVDHSWQTSAREYVKVYRRSREAATHRGGGERAVS